MRTDDGSIERQVLSMILNVTNEQKKLIESQGFMVVEFKLWYRKLGEMLLEYAQRIIDTRKATILFIQEKMNRAFDTLKDFADKIKPYIEEMQELQEFEYEERPKYPFIRSIGKKYRPNFNNKVVYHRCRDRC